jgi:hypothetical protein
MDLRLYSMHTSVFNSVNQLNKRKHVMTAETGVSSTAIEWKPIDAQGARTKGTMQWTLENHRISGSIDSVISEMTPAWIGRLDTGELIPIEALDSNATQWLLLVEATVLNMDDALLVHLSIDSVCPDLAKPLVLQGSQLESFATPCLAMTLQEQRALLESSSQHLPRTTRQRTVTIAPVLAPSIPDEHQETGGHSRLVVLLALCLLFWFRVAIYLKPSKRVNGWQR